MGTPMAAFLCIKRLKSSGKHVKPTIKAANQNFIDVNFLKMYNMDEHLK